MTISENSLAEMTRKLELLINPPTDLPGFSHVDGLWWYQAPIPRRWHRCKPWTTSLEHQIERCACGALRFTSGPGAGHWGDKNTRVKRS